MTVLITGGAGYIGSHTIRQLLARGEDVVAFDSLEQGHREAIDGVPLTVGSTLDRAAIDAVFSSYDIDAVVHFAALKAAGESMEQPGRYFRNNVDGTLTLLEAATAAGVRAFVFSSTAAVYGTPESLPVDETAPLHPENPYGESKLICEQMLRWFDRSHGLKHVALRYFNATGASAEGSIGEDWSITLNLVPIVMKATLEKGPKLTVFGTDYPTPDGTAIRDYVHVDDLADAHLRALDYLRDGGQSRAINLGTGIGSSVQQVIDMTEAVSGVRVPREYAERRQGDPSAVFADNRLAKELLGTQQCRAEDIEAVRARYAGHDIPAELGTYFENMATRLADAHLFIGRAGASTIAELTAVGRPAILIPLPIATDDHQAANTREMVASGGARMIRQDKFSAAELAKQIQAMAQRPETLATAAHAAWNCGYPNAAIDLADLVESFGGSPLMDVIRMAQSVSATGQEQVA